MKTTNNFMQIKEQTFEQKVEMYMQCDKKKLAEMLAMRDMIDEQKNKEKENIVEPYFPNKSSLPYWYNHSSWPAHFGTLHGRPCESRRP